MRYLNNFIEYVSQNFFENFIHHEFDQNQWKKKIAKWNKKTSIPFFIWLKNSWIKT